MKDQCCQGRMSQSCSQNPQIVYMRDKPMDSDNEVFHDCESESDLRNHDVRNVTRNLSNPQEFHETLKEFVFMAQQLCEMNSEFRPGNRNDQARSRQPSQQLLEANRNLHPSNSINLEIHLQIPQDAKGQMKYQVTANKTYNSVPIGNTTQSIDLPRDQGMLPNRTSSNCGKQQLSVDKVMPSCSQPPGQSTNYDKYICAGKKEVESSGVEPKKSPGSCGMQHLSGDKSVACCSQPLIAPKTSGNINYSQTTEHGTQNNISETSFPIRGSVSEADDTFPIRQSTCGGAVSVRISAVGETFFSQIKRFLTTLASYLGGYADLKLDELKTSAYAIETDTALSTNNLAEEPRPSNRSHILAQSPVIFIYPPQQQSMPSKPPSYASIACEHTYNGSYSGENGVQGTCHEHCPSLQPTPPRSPRPSTKLTVLEPTVSEITLVPEGEQECCTREEVEGNVICGNLTSEERVVPTIKEEAALKYSADCRCGNKYDVNILKKCVCNAGGQMDEDCRLPKCIEEQGVCNCDCSNPTERTRNLMHCCNLAIDSDCFCQGYYADKPYKIALPQHRDIEVCIGCRFDPSPLIDEEGKVFCPGDCGCCLCPWQRRKTDSKQRLLVHDKLRVCKCRDRGTLFSMRTRDSICSKTSEFDVCPCRDKAEAKFLELYDKEMATMDELQLDKLRGGPVFLKDVIELRPPAKMKQKFSKKNKK